MAVVKLFGAWFSSYAYRVIWALKLKGIPYEYIEEDLRNKSPLLLQYNPIHKKVPVLVHDGKPICESTVILQYIDEIWPQNPMLPADPYDKAVALFWIKFADDKGYLMSKLYRADGEEQQAAVKEWLEMLDVMEEHALIGVKKFFGGDDINMVDIAFSFVAHWLGVLEDVVGLKIFEPHKFPRRDDVDIKIELRFGHLCSLSKRPLISKLFRTDGEEQQAVAKECFEMLEVLEEHALIGGKKFFGGDEINMVDIAFCSVAHWLGVIEDFAGLKIFEPHKFPRLNSWIQNFKSVPVIKGNLLDTDKMLVLLKRRREMLLASKSS
ncbi:hypothetical protein Gotur_028022 [Gossypium turneri]